MHDHYRNMTVVHNSLIKNIMILEIDLHRSSTKNKWKNIVLNLFTWYRNKILLEKFKDAFYFLVWKSNSLEDIFT